MLWQRVYGQRLSWPMSKTTATLAYNSRGPATGGEQRSRPPRRSSKSWLKAMSQYLGQAARTCPSLQQGFQSRSISSDSAYSMSPQVFSNGIIQGTGGQRLMTTSYTRFLRARRTTALARHSSTSQSTSLATRIAGFSTSSCIKARTLT